MQIELNYPDPLPLELDAGKTLLLIEIESLLERFNLRPGDARIIVTGIASRSCVQCAMTGFSIRSYYVYVPIDCTGQR